MRAALNTPAAMAAMQTTTPKEPKGFLRGGPELLPPHKATYVFVSRTPGLRLSRTAYHQSRKAGGLYVPARRGVKRNRAISEPRDHAAPDALNP